MRAPGRAALPRPGDHLAHLGAPGLHGGQLLERGVGAASATIRASVVLPVPGRPVEDHRVRRGPSRSPCAAPSPRRAGGSWPTNSSSARGRIRAASGASAGAADSRPRAAPRRVEQLVHAPQYRGAADSRCPADGRPRDATRGTRPPSCSPQLIRFDTVNPPGDERAAQEWLAGPARARGLRGRARRRAARAPEPRRAAARARRRPVLVPALARRHGARRRRRLEHDPWARRDRRRLRVGPRRARHEVPDRGRGRRRSSRSPARAGARRAATCWSSSVVDEEAGGAEGAQWLCREPPGPRALRLPAQRGRRPVMPYGDARVCTASASPRRASFRFRVTHAASPGTRRSRASATTRWSSSRRCSQRSATGAPASTSPRRRRRCSRRSAKIRRPGAPRSSSGRATRPAAGDAWSSRRCGVTLAPTMICAARQKINVIPARAELQRRLPRPAGDRRGRARACALHELLGDDDGSRSSSPSRSSATRRRSSRR